MAFAITMVYNESLFLNRWIDYYSKELGRDKLLIIDHGSNDGSTNNLSGLNYLKLERTPFDDEARAAMIGNFVNGLLSYNDCCIYSDCDEFLVPDPDIYEGLEHYCSSLKTEAAYAVGLDVRQLVGREPPIDLNLPFLGQRRYARLRMSMCKPLITKGQIRWNPGFHTSNKKPGFDKDLILFHMKYVDLNASLSRLAVTRAMSWSEVSIDKKRGAHQRETDEKMQGRFLNDKKSFDAGPEKFDFQEEERLINEGAYSDSKGNYIKGLEYNNKYVEIPERFFGIV